VVKAFWAQWLAAVSRSAIGVDSDPAYALRKLRCGQAVFDVITFVASIYHLPLRESLCKARQMLRPGGELAIVDLSVKKSIADWTWAGLCTPARRCLYYRYRLLWRNG
jgi:2-polyprenyl-3-methyl-5-hydroxy-6-metoxy-1,4-benzoquinol methylase